MTRRDFFTALTGAVAATAQAKDPKVDVVYMVECHCKCTEKHANTLVNMLNVTGRAWGHLPKYPEDWVVTKKLYGAWQR